MFMRIEDQNGTIVHSAEIADDVIMDAEAFLFAYLGDFDFDRVVEVSQRAEDNGCYDHRVIFFEDEENPDHIMASSAFWVYGD